jgi:DNA-binding beta-propeller fold protein YncE
VDWWNQRIEKFSAAGNLVTAWGHRGTKAEPGSINFAWDTAVDPASGNVYLANRESHEIEVFSPSGDYVTRWGYRGAANGKFVFPQGVAFDPTDGTLLVSDSGNNRIQRFKILASGKGSWIASYGSAGTAPGQFATPTGIDVAADGTIWVADTQNDRIQKRNPATGAWTAYTAAAGDAATFKSPWGVSVAPGGEIWVADTNQDRLVRMTSSGALNSTVDAGSLGIATMDAPFTVEFGTAGQIYVSVVWDNRILHLDES